MPTLASNSTARRCASAADDLRDLAADGENGVERGQRILKYDRHLTAANLEQSRRRQGEQIPAIEGRAHGMRFGAPRQQTQQRQHRQRLAGS